MRWQPVREVFAAAIARDDPHTVVKARPGEAPTSGDTDMAETRIPITDRPDTTTVALMGINKVMGAVAVIMEAGEASKGMDAADIREIGVASKEMAAEEAAGKASKEIAMEKAAGVASKVTATEKAAGVAVKGMVKGMAMFKQPMMKIAIVAQVSTAERSNITIREHEHLTSHSAIRKLSSRCGAVDSAVWAMQAAVRSLVKALVDLVARLAPLWVYFP